MDKNAENIVREDMAAIANEITFHSYAISKFGVQSLFQKMTAADYMALMKLSKTIDSTEENQKIYLEDIANEMKLPMGSVSKLVRALQERGLVAWKHDGKGDEGTYIQITDKGINSLLDQQEILKNFYKNVIERFGKEKFIALLEQLKELEEIMDSEIEEGEKIDD